MLTINKTYCISSDDRMTAVIYLNKENGSYNLSVSDIAGETVELRLDEILASELFAALDAMRQTDGVGHTTVGKYTVDTCSNGENYETAIWINPDRMAIPTVYPNRLAAEQEHKLWCVMAAAAPTQVWDTATNTYLTL